MSLSAVLYYPLFLFPGRPLVKKAYLDMKKAGVGIADAGPWNLLWDGDCVTVIDYIDTSFL